MCNKNIETESNESEPQIDNGPTRAANANKYKLWIWALLGLLIICVARYAIDKLGQPACVVAIGILSARENFHMRSALRATWIQETSNQSQQCKFKPYFIIGDDACPLHPNYRDDIYDCRDRKLIFKESDYDKIIELTSKTEENAKLNVCFLNSYIFKVKETITIAQLGILGEINACVYLHEVTSGKQIEHVCFKNANNFEIERPMGNLKVRYESIDNYILPRGFLGKISIRSCEKQMDCSPEKLCTTIEGFQLTVDENVVQLMIEDPSDSARPINSSWMFTGLFTYKLHTLEKEKEMRQYWQEQWDRKTSEQSILLQHEIRQHNDIYLARGIVDTYRNLPNKLLAFFAWLSETQDFDFVLKMDDDSFLNVYKLNQEISKLLQENLSTAKLWWGRFRYNWLVDRYGKWAEHHYLSKLYPPFACGVGSLLSRDLIAWLAANREMLKVFQGEDTSLGIWLAAVQPNYINSSLWSCGATCSNEMLIRGELDQEKIQLAWISLKTCGNLCGCK